jgi:uncharacterized RDD family membrane protein YckC
MHKVDIVIWKFVGKIMCALHACDDVIDWKFAFVGICIEFLIGS